MAESLREAPLTSATPLADRGADQVSVPVDAAISSDHPLQPHRAPGNASPRSARRVASPLAGLLRAGEETTDAVGEDGFRADVVFAVKASVGGGLFCVDRSVLLVGGHGGGERAADH